MVHELIVEEPVLTVPCWMCAGVGFHDGECECQAFEDTCVCAVPEPPVCEECKGAGRL